MTRWLRTSLLFAVAVSLLVIASLRGVIAQPQKEGITTNFIFLIDVSGSMLFDSNTVTTAEGERITLFEALRKALIEIVKDERLIAPSSRVEFITFGTRVEEKSSWVKRLDTNTDRENLIRLLSSEKELAADPKGDTYMARALRLAYDRAVTFPGSSEKCAVNFIVMLTDGYDDPPAGASVKLNEVALLFTRKQKTLMEASGTNNWVVRVIGLQAPTNIRPDITTAPQVAEMLSGRFISVESKESAPEKIFDALKATLQSFQSQIQVEGLTQGEYLDFGRVRPDEEQTASFRLYSRSCREEEVSGVQDKSSEISSDFVDRLSESLGSLTPVAGELKDLIRLQLTEPKLIIGRQGEPGEDQTVSIALKISENIKPGAYIGRAELISTANVTPIYYLFRVSSRIDAPKIVKAQARKAELFSSAQTMINIPLSVSLLATREEPLGVVEISLPELQRQVKAGEPVGLITANQITLRMGDTKGNPLSLNATPISHSIAFS